MPNFDKPADIDFQIVRGDSRDKKFTILLDGVALNVSAGSMAFLADDGTTTIGPLVGVVAGAGNNEVTVSFVPADTAVTGTYDYDLQQTVAADRFTYVVGKLVITGDVNAA